MRRPIGGSAGDDPAAAVVCDALPQFDPGGAPLIVDEASGRLAAVLAARGVTAHEWHRCCRGRRGASAWPAGGPFSSAFVRMPKAKGALDFALHASASVLPPGAPIIVFGANDEGIRSAVTHLDAVAEGTATVDTRRHCRVLAGKRRAKIAMLKASLSEWRQEAEVEIAGRLRTWAFYPGVFAAGRIDEGTRMLLEHLPALNGAGRVLDFGCSSGVIGAEVKERNPNAAVDLLDTDAVALEAARENVPGTRTLLRDGLAPEGPRYDAILSNPPLHEGVAQSFDVLERFIAAAVQRLRVAGLLQLVVQRRINAAELIEAAFGNVAVIAETSRYRVLRAVRRGAA